jgi:hypothetical protein
MKTFILLLLSVLIIPENFLFATEPGSINCPKKANGFVILKDDWGIVSNNRNSMNTAIANTNNSLFIENSTKMNTNNLYFSPRVSSTSLNPPKKMNIKSVVNKYNDTELLKESSWKRSADNNFDLTNTIAWGLLGSACLCLFHQKGTDDWAGLIFGGFGLGALVGQIEWNKAGSY